MNGKGWFLPILGLLVAFQPALDASTPLPIGAVIGSGASRVNGVPVPAGAVLYSGDRIATGTAGPASIHLRRNDELVLGTSTDLSVTVKGTGFLVRLHRGKVAVIGSPDAPVVVRAGEIAVETGQANGLYEVALRGDELKVWTRRGTTLVKGGGRTVVVAAGNLMKARLAPGGLSGKSGEILIVAMSTAAAAGAAAGLGVVLAAPGATCVSPSQLTCP